MITFVKKLFLLSSVLFSLSSTLAFSQGWYTQASGISNGLNAVYLTDANTGTAVGNTGKILHTTNGGLTWPSQTSGTSQQLNAIWFPTPTTGFVAGNTGTILRTTNGGTSWSSQTSGTSSHLNGISFYDANNGIAVGNGGKILRTTDGGTSWTSLTSGSNDLNEVAFPSLTSATAVGAGGTILHSTNGGTTWTAQSSGTTLTLRGVSFPDANTGTAVGADGKIVQTTNGGTSWSSQTSGTTQTLKAVFFKSLLKGNAVGADGTILRTTNGGTAWTSQSIAGGKDLYGVHFADDNTGNAVGSVGTIVRTTTGGSACATITLSPPTLLSGTVGSSYSQTVTSAGGAGPYTYGVSSGVLPPGLSLSSAGLLSGTPATPGLFTFNITSQDNNGCTGNRTYAITISCASLALLPASLPGSVEGTFYSQAVTASGGTGPYSFTVTIGSLPAGLTLSSGGLLSGTPTVNGNFSFTITSTDANGCYGSRNLTLVVTCPTITITPPTLPPPTSGTFYSQTLSAGGGAGAYTFAVTGGTLPAGLSLTSGGVLSGTPSIIGASSFTVSATDAQGCIGNRLYSLTVSCPTITVSPSTLPGGTVGSAYGVSFTASGGASPYTFSVTSGAIPAGMTLSPGGSLSGSPTASGTSSFTITSTDNQGCTGSRAYSLIVGCGTITILPASLSSAPVGTPYSVSLVSSGGTGTYTYAVSGGTLPAGLTLSPSGSLSGTPTSPGTYNFGVTSTDAAGCTGVRSYTLIVACPAISLLPATLPGALVGASYSQTISSSGGTSPYNYSVSSGSLPGGLSLSSAGLLSGTTTASGSFSFTISSSDANGCTGSRSYSVLVGCPVITLSSLPTGIIGAGYSQTITATNAVTPVSFAVTAGTLPNGLTLSPSGVLSGTPTTAGSFTFSITATDANACAGNQSYSINMNCPAIALSGLPNGIVGLSYSQSITAGGGTAPWTFSVTSGSLPAGLTLSAGGVLSGTPASAGSSSFTIQSTDAYGCAGSQSYAISFSCNPIALSPSSLPNGTAGIGYSETMTGSGGNAPYVFTVTGGTLPTGLSLSSGGVLSGTPGANGTYSFDVTVTDNYGCAQTQGYSVTIGSCPTITVAPPALTNGTESASYSETLTGSGGTAPYTFAVTAGALPAGLSLSPAGVLSGIPSAAGSSTFTVTSTDDGGCVGTRSYTMIVCSTIGLSALSNGVVGAPYAQTITPAGGTAPYSYGVTSGSLPAGLSLSGSGVLSGTPSATGSSSFTVTATDANGCTGNQAYAISMTCPPIALSPASLPNGSVGNLYSESIVAGGGSPAYTFTLSAGTLPPGVTLSAAGVVSGSPFAAGSYSFTITSTDAFGCAGSRSYSIAVDCPVINVSPASLTGGTVGVAYSQTITSSGGTSPYIYSVASGSLPVGLTLLSSGLLSGTPVGSGNFTFSVLATDAQGCSGTRSYSVTIGCPAIALTPVSIPNAVAHASYSRTLSATGGSGPYAFSLASGSLPPGVVVSSGGIITGTPVQVGSYSFTIAATDIHNCSGTQSYTLVVDCPPLVISPGTLSNGTAGTPYSQTFSATGGSAPYTFALAAGALPPGLLLSPSGVLSGTPTQTGNYSFSISGTDAQGCPVVQPYSVVISCPVIGVSPSSLPSATSGMSYNQSFAAAGGTGPYTYLITSGSLPAGMTLSSAGVLSGTPLGAGSYSFTVTATDAQGCAGVRVSAISVNCPAISISPSSLPNGTVGSGYNHTLTPSGGVSPYNFVLISGSLPPGVSLSSAGLLSGTPTVGGNYTFSLSATDIAGCAASQSYTVSIGTTPGFSVSPGSIGFGTLLVGASKRDSVVVANPGTGPLTVFSVSSDDGNYNVTPGSAVIAPGASRKFYITFAPAGTGPKPANILFSHSAVGSPDTVTVTGVGVAPVFSILTSLSFGNVLIGNTGGDSVRVQNSGTTTLNISSAASDNGEFSVAPASVSLAPGAIQTFTVTFTPVTIGTKSGSIEFTHNGSDAVNFVPIDGIGVVNLKVMKFRDGDGNTGTIADRTAKRWHFGIYADTVSPAHLVAEAESTVVVTQISLIGNYIVAESDSAPLWTRINGNLTRFDTLFIANASVADTFVNFRINGITLRKFEDGDGIFATSGDRIPKQWHLEIRRDSLHGPLVAAGNAATLAAPVLGDGTYYCIEADSANWVHLGTIADGNPDDGGENGIRVDLANGESATVDFVNARDSFYKMYRSFSPQSLSQLRPVKKKFAARAFCAQFVNAGPAIVNGLRVVFTRNTLAGVVVNVTAHAPFTTAASLDGRTWDFTGAAVSHLEGVTICGVSNFGKELQVVEWEWLSNGIPQAKQPKFIPSDQRPMLSMPNFANIRNEVFAQGGFSLPRTDGFVVGIPRTDSVKKYGWVRMRSGAVLQKSLFDRTGYHVGFARGFDRYINGDPFVKEQKYLRPIKQNNHLFGEIVLLKFAITASALGVTPNGFGELLYNEGSGNPLSGLTLSQIASRVDSAMTYWRDAPWRGWSFDNFDTTLTKINRAFDGPVDTARYMAGLAVTGVRPLVEVAFLRPNDQAIPMKIEPLANRISDIPQKFTLYQNYPNPFNPTTTITFDLPFAATVSLKIYNILGQEVAAPVAREYMDEGNYDVEFDANALSSGIYFYRIIAETVTQDEDSPVPQTFIDVRKMVLVK